MSISVKLHEMGSIVLLNQQAAQTGSENEPVGRRKTYVPCGCFYEWNF